jgi:hypothetical protein
MPLSEHGWMPITGARLCRIEKDILGIADEVLVEAIRIFHACHDVLC